MERKVGTISRGVRCPITCEGDNLIEIVVGSVLDVVESEGLEIEDRGVISVTKSVVVRAQGNYASIDAIARDIKTKLGGETIGVIFSILSRNHFSTRLKGTAKGAKKVMLILSYPSDEVGDSLVSLNQADEAGTNPYSNVLDLKCYREPFGENKHSFTDVDHVAYYCQLIEEQGAKAQVVFADNPKEILDYTKWVLTRDIYSRMRARRTLEEVGAEAVCGMDDTLNAPVDGSGCNEKYGLLGSNRLTEDITKLLSWDCMDLVSDIQNKVLDRIGKYVEVMVYGDGMFKDPIRKIWELTDPMVSATNTEGPEGVPNEAKLKYLADNGFKDLPGEVSKNTVSQRIKEKKSDLVGDMASQGTTPRRLTDLIESPCDLTSGSGDKGTPATLVQGYFDNYVN